MGRDWECEVCRRAQDRHSDPAAFLRGRRTRKLHLICSFHKDAFLNADVEGKPGVTKDDFVPIDEGMDEWIAQQVPGT